MKRNTRIGLVAGGAIWLITIMGYYLHKANFVILQPQGVVAAKERNLLILTLVLGLSVAIPVYVMTILFAWRYRETNHKAKYEPNLGGNVVAELVWWGIPGAIILVLSVLTWQSSHALDPHRSIAASGKPLHVQVIALDWKWLFIYPEQHVASVNFVELPVNSPITFDITADAPMNSFWIPQLGSQIYAMPGMSTKLNLVANKTGDFDGSSANMSGRGFSSMKFTAHVDRKNDFNNWVMLAKQSPSALDKSAYKLLSQPSENTKSLLFNSVDDDIYASTVLKYMSPEVSRAR